MSQDKIILIEHCNVSNEEYAFCKNENKQIYRMLYSSRNVAKTLVNPAITFLKEVLLPSGYPFSVSQDYAQYQAWDTLQAFCSTITGIFTTKAILAGVGVGNAEASALSATVTWIVKDGTGMIGRIIFAWWKGNDLDCDCKKWRLCADILNDAAMLLELCLPFINSNPMEILCISTTMKSLVGVAGGATRASITNHQAIKSNSAEIAAKDGTQETLVNLLASFTGIFLLNYLTNNFAQWAFIVFLMIFHIYSNYRAVTALVFNDVNLARLNLILRSYLSLNAVPPPNKINKLESVILGFGIKCKDICGYDISIGETVKDITQFYEPEELKSTVQQYMDKNYLLLLDCKKKKIYICLEKGESPQDVVEACFHAILTAIAIALNSSQEIYTKKQLHHTTPITRLSTYLKSSSTNSVESGKRLNTTHIFLKEFIEQEIQMFMTAYYMSGWKIDHHSIYVGEWRTQWKKHNKLD